jgi:hypothetical protein
MVVHRGGAEFAESESEIHAGFAEDAERFKRV